MCTTSGCQRLKKKHYGSQILEICKFERKICAYEISDNEYFKKQKSNKNMLFSVRII